MKIFRSWKSALGLSLLVASTSATFGVEEKAKKPDVLFIMAEDLSARLHCYGNEQVKTPNLDALAKKGVLFQNAQNQYAVCNPSRTSIFSGLRPATTGAFNNGDDHNKTLKPGTTIPEVFHANGYESVGIGKLFHVDVGAKPMDSTWRYSRHIPIEGEFDTFSNPKTKRTLLENLSPELKEKFKRHTWGWSILEGDDADTVDGKIARKAAEVLNEKSDKPLFLAVGFHATHTSWNSPKKYYDMYPKDKIVLKDKIYPMNDLEDVPANRYSDTYSRELFDDEIRTEAMQALFANLTFLDTQVGLVLDALKKSGREDNTIVVFFSDHGLHTGEHHLWRKKTFFEEGVKVPLIAYAPKANTPGAVCERPVELVDVFPTLLDYCGLEIPKTLEGTSFVPLLKDPKRPWKKGAFSYHVVGSKSRELGTSIRTERYRYNEWGSPDVAELYDHEKDPYEITNVVKDPAYKDVVAELSTLVKNGWKAALPDSSK